MFQAEEQNGCPNAGTVNGDGVHSCSKCNVLHQALFPAYAERTQSRDNNSCVISDTESTMNHIVMQLEETDILMLAPTADDMDIVQSVTVEASGGVTTKVAKQ